MTLENVLLEPTLDTVKGILILDNDGKRILAKWVVRSYDFLIFILKLFRYYDSESFPTTAAQKKFEKSLFTKTHKVSNCLSLTFLMTSIIRPTPRSSCWTDLLVSTSQVWTSSSMW